jgi:hypothetical protein
MMARRFWITGLSLAVIVYSGFVVFCIVSLITHRHLDLKGWTILILSAYAGYFAFGRLRVVLKSGDPTTELNPKIPE